MQLNDVRPLVENFRLLVSHPAGIFLVSLADDGSSEGWHAHQKVQTHWEKIYAEV